jgi:hypothetical protein
MPEKHIENDKEQSDLDEKHFSKKEKPDNSDNISLVDQNNQKTKHIEWSPENEMIMVEWCDIAQCYKWLNSRANNYYAYLHAWFTIPAITLSTISGTASFAQASLPTNYQVYAPMIIGALNIFIGILTTVQQYLKISELNEAHRVSAISWDKFARNIRIELSKAPNERMDAGQFIKISRQEFDRLMETSPAVSSKIIQEFQKSFQGKPNSIERKRFEALKKPDICNIIITANEYRHPWYLQEPEALTEEAKEQIKAKELAIREKDDIIRSKEIEEEDKKKKKQEIQDKFHKTIKEATNKYKSETKLIDEYVSRFYSLYDREPIYDEILRHGEELVESQKIDRETLTKYLETKNGENVIIEML